MRNLYRPNLYDTPCHLCGEIVKAGTGSLFSKRGRDINHERTRQPEWVVQHKKCKKVKNDVPIN
jgi:ribosomal protein L24E